MVIDPVGGPVAHELAVEEGAAADGVAALPVGRLVGSVAGVVHAALADGLGVGQRD